MAELDRRGSTDRDGHQRDLWGGVLVMQWLLHTKLSPTTVCTTKALRGSTQPPPTAAQFWHQCLLLRTLMWPVERRGPLFCVSSTVERNSIFQGDDVRSANMETGDWGESRYSVAEVARTFWPHIICCDTGQDKACTWSIWQDVRHRFTLCLSIVRQTSIWVKRQNNVIWQEAALQ